jgi:hypothetical protein
MSNKHKTQQPALPQLNKQPFYTHGMQQDFRKRCSTTQCNTGWSTSRTNQIQKYISRYTQTFLFHDGNYTHNPTVNVHCLLLCRYTQNSSVSKCLLLCIFQYISDVSNYNSQFFHTYITLTSYIISLIRSTRSRWTPQIRNTQCKHMYMFLLTTVNNLLTWRWPITAETCRHRRSNKLRYLDSCVFDGPTHHNLHKTQQGW